MQISASSTVSPFLAAKPPTGIRQGKSQIASSGASMTVPTTKQAQVATLGTASLRTGGLGALERMAVSSRGDMAHPMSSKSLPIRARIEQAGHQQTSAPQPDPEVTLDGLLKAWGTNEAMYDLNGDGTVDVLDLLQFLGSQT